MELCHRFGRHMRAHGKPSYISNVASLAGYQPLPNFAVYAATKHFVRVFSEILRHELANSKVRVSCLCPGGTYTEFSEKNGQAIRESGHAAMMTAQEVARQGIAGMLAGRAVIVPGFLNKITCALPRFIPSGLSITLAERVMKRATESTWQKS
jgi:short-subunit dehydrogenase